MNRFHSRLHCLSRKLRRSLLLRRHQRLGEHLAAVHPAGAEVAVAAAVDVDLERREVEEIDELRQGAGHA